MRLRFHFRIKARVREWGLPSIITNSSVALLASTKRFQLALLMPYLDERERVRVREKEQERERERDRERERERER
jgi:hypothetical protein